MVPAAQPQVLIHRSLRRALALAVLVGSLKGTSPAATPVDVPVVRGEHEMVVAGHPRVAQLGLETLAAGGNAVDAAITVSLSLGVAEPYGSGLGGKLLLLYYEAESGQTFAVDALDAVASTVHATVTEAWTRDDVDHGWRAVGVPGLAAGLALAHARWGVRPWAEDVAPAGRLARDGFEVLPKTRARMAEKLDVLRADPELTRLYLPAGELPGVGSRLTNPELAQTLLQLAREGAAAIYDGPVGQAMADAASAAGAHLTMADLEAYQPRLTETVQLRFGDHVIIAGAPPATGAALVFPPLKALEGFAWPDDGLRTAAALDRLPRVWRAALPAVYRDIADTPDARDRFERLLDAAHLDEIRKAAERPQLETARAPDPDDRTSTTHFVIVDRHGNIVSATQSLGAHFGAGVVAPGTGIVMNDSLNNFSFNEPASPNRPAPGKRPRTTIAPLIVLHGDRPVLALGVPGGSRIPTATFQVLLDTLVLQRPLVEALGDTRWHLNPASRNRRGDVIEVEASLAPETVAGLEARGWEVKLVEPAGSGGHFGGFAAVEILPDGTRLGYADPRRTNAAAGR